MQTETVIDKDAARRKLWASFKAFRPQTDEELHLVIKEYLDLDIPNRKICPEHDAPFKFVADQFHERTQNMLGFANRSGGKTINTAALNVVDSEFRPGLETLCAGAIEEQANQGYEYIGDFLGKEELLAQDTYYIKKAETLLTNGSKIKTCTATVSGLNGPHPVRFRLDEIELLGPWIIGQGLSMSQSKKGYRGQNTFTSTRKIHNGTMQKLLDEAPQKGIDIVRWCVWETLETCTRKCKGDPVYGDCRAYSRFDKDGKEEGLCGILDGAPEAHGKAQALPPGGYYKIDDFVQKVGVLDVETFEAEWLCSRPSPGLLIYGKHWKKEAPYIVYAPEKEEILERAKTEGNWVRVVAIDFGARFGVGYFMRDPRPPRRWYQYFELYWPPSMNLSLQLRAKEIREHDPLGWSSRVLVYADPAGRQQIIDLNTYGVAAEPAVNDVAAGIDYVKVLMTRDPQSKLPGFRMFDNCEQSIREVDGYRHPEKKDGTVDFDKILKEDDEMPDVIRYGMYSYFKMSGGNSYSQRKLKGYN